MPCCTVGITEKDFAAAAIGAFHSSLESVTDCYQKPRSLRGAAQRANLVAGLHSDADVQDSAVIEQSFGNLDSLRDPWRKNQKTVIGAAATGRGELDWRHSAGHAAGFNKFIHAACVMRDLRSVSATTASSKLEEHRTLIGIAEFNVSCTLCESESAYRVMAHIGNG